MVGLNPFEGRVLANEDVFWNLIESASGSRRPSIIPTYFFICSFVGRIGRAYSTFVDVGIGRRVAGSEVKI